jgi:hypothetical protein
VVPFPSRLQAIMNPSVILTIASFGLVAAKLDGLLGWSWLVVLAPLAILVALTIGAVDQACDDVAAQMADDELHGR